MAYKIKIILTDENGNDYVGEAALSALPRKAKGKIIKAKASPTIRVAKSSLDFDLNIHAFMKKIGAKHLSGPVKITALIAHLSKGDIGTPVKASDVRKQWSKMKSILGNFNNFYYMPAKQNAWIDPVKPASYKVRKEGIEILRGKA